MSSRSIQPRKEKFPLCVAMGAVLRELREKLGWSLEELSVRAGVSRQTVTHVECGTHSPKVDTVERIAKALGVLLERVVAMARRWQKSRSEKC